MWRRGIFNNAAVRKAVIRFLAEKSDRNRDKTNDIHFYKIIQWGTRVTYTRFTEITQWSKRVVQRNDMSILLHIISLLFGIDRLRDIIEEEKLRGRKEEHVILIGKQKSGIDLVRKALLEKDYQLESKQCKKGKDIGIEMVDRTGEHDNRGVKITCLYLNSTSVLSSDELSSLSISENYSVVFCFPITYRFTKDDWSLLETYLNYRQSENFQKISIAFTNAEHLDNKGIDEDEYIENLPDRATKLLTECSDKYYFIRSKSGQQVNNNKTVMQLLKPLPSEEYHTELSKRAGIYYIPYNELLKRVR